MFGRWTFSVVDQSVWNLIDSFHDHEIGRDSLTEHIYLHHHHYSACTISA